MARVTYLVEGWDEDAVYAVFESDLADRYMGKEGANGEVREELYRTDQGLWVLNLVGGESGESSYMKIKDGRASAWLKANGHNEAVRRWFGEKTKVGRPPKGDRVAIRITARNREYLENLAEQWGVPYADAVTRILGLGIGHHKMARWFDRDRLISDGITQAVRGETRDLGDFSRYRTKDN